MADSVDIQIMDWDKFKMAQKFLQRANAIHPEDAINGTLQEQALALQNVYYDCYMSSFSKEALITRLQRIIDGNFEMPEDENVVNEKQYREAYMAEARIVLASIEREVS